MAMYKVQKGEPIPPINYSSQGRHRKYPFDTMEVGDLFFVPGKTVKAVSSYISRATKGMTCRFTTRHEWRIKMSDGTWKLAAEGDEGAVEGTTVWRET